MLVHTQAGTGELVIGVEESHAVSNEQSTPRVSRAAPTILPGLSFKTNDLYAAKRSQASSVANEPKHCTRLSRYQP